MHSLSTLTGCLGDRVLNRDGRFTVYVSSYIDRNCRKFFTMVWVFSLRLKPGMGSFFCVELRHVVK